MAHRIDFVSCMACTHYIMACYTAFVAAPGQGKTTAAQSLLWELQKTPKAINHMSAPMQTAVRICCQEGLVWRYAVVYLEVSQLGMHNKASQVLVPKTGLARFSSSLVIMNV